MVSVPPHYEALGVPTDADGAAIKAGYRRRARQCHPDVTGGASTARFILVNNAYRVLSDPIARARYDREIGIAVDSSVQPQDGSGLGRTGPGSHPGAHEGAAAAHGGAARRPGGRFGGHSATSRPPAELLTTALRLAGSVPKRAALRIVGVSFLLTLGGQYAAWWQQGPPRRTTLAVLTLLWLALTTGWLVRVAVRPTSYAEHALVAVTAATVGHYTVALLIWPPFWVLIFAYAVWATTLLSLPRPARDHEAWRSWWRCQRGRRAAALRIAVTTVVAYVVTGAPQSHRCPE
jgi:hypothetical protein